MEMKINREGGYEYVESGTGPVLLLLHGLFGALSNWQHVMHDFSAHYRVIIPLLPIYKKTQVSPSIEGLSEFVANFVQFKSLPPAVVLGNSLGGHIALLYALKNPEQVKALVLTGSSGLFESGMGSTFPRRGDYNYIRERVAYTFFDPRMASGELTGEVFEIVNDNYKALRILHIARAAQRQNLRKVIGGLKCRVLLVWGLNDNITPPHVAHEFHKLLPNSQLAFIDRCGHAAMMEQNGRFNALLTQFLQRTIDNIELKN
jgi:pimeloyl-ACP methyl ester carboxylesterase